MLVVVETVSVGMLFTVILCVALPEHPLAVAVTVYSVVPPGVTTRELALTPPGFHT